VSAATPQFEHFLRKKKIRAAHAKEKQQIQKRAAARIALTC